MVESDLSVRRLAEFVFRTGDLHKPRRGRVVAAEEGIAVQKKLQKQRLQMAAHYQREVPLQLMLDAGVASAEGLWPTPEVSLQGRVDGLLYNPDASSLLIEEFKCCGELPEVVDPVDWGQAVIYAGLHAFSGDARGAGGAGDKDAGDKDGAGDDGDADDKDGPGNNDEKPEEYRVAVVYAHADTLEERIFAHTMTASGVRSTLAFVLLCYQVRINRHLLRCQQRRLYSEHLQFPFANYRSSQQAIARRIFRAIRERENLLLEAPTGSGKTIAVLYPAVRSQEVGEQLFFLTSRNVGAQAALAAVGQLDKQRSHLVTVELTAKEKTCPVAGTPCNAELCPNAKGYFDRSPAAVDELVQRCIADRSAIEEVAAKHQVCPFELSLDTALWADLIIGDYNYAFDPMVRLQRFAKHQGLHLLIDEAHQLSPRTREMLAVEFDHASILAACAGAPQVIVKTSKSIARALKKLGKAPAEHKSEGKSEGKDEGVGEGKAIAKGEGEHEVPLSELTSFERAVNRLLDAVQDAHTELSAWPAAQALYYNCLRWRRSAAWFNEDTFTHILQVDGKRLLLRRLCMDPSAHISSVLAEHGASVRFSGTVSPLPLYQRMHGLPEAAAERARSPFSTEQVKILNVIDVPTYYRQRQAGLSGIAGVMADLMAARPGRYLVALPSYAYLQALYYRLQERLQDQLQADELQAHPPTDKLCLLAQNRQQNHADHQQLLDSFAQTNNVVMLVVSGGVFGESVDFSEAQLQGVVVVGLGLPPPSLERRLIARHFDQQEGAGWGNMVAYTQPALVKNIQVAGRMIRSAEDRGLICLIDPRFARAEIQQFFPSHWRPCAVRASEVAAEAKSFWLGG